MTDRRAKKDPRRRIAAPAFVELPTGLFTAEGLWFHTTRQDLEAFAGPVLERTGVEELLQRATAWIRSPETLALWVFLAALLTRHVPTALLAGLVAFLGWSILHPGLVFRPLTRVAGWLQHPMIAGVAYVIGLSWLAGGDNLWALAAGLAWFVLVRWGLLTRACHPLLRRIQARLYRLPPADQVLRGVIIRYALAYRVAVGDLQAMEDRILEIAGRHRKN